MLHGLRLDSRLLKDYDGCRMALSKRRESRDSTTQVALPYEREPAMRNYAGSKKCNFGSIVVDKMRQMHVPLLESR